MPWSLNQSATKSQGILMLVYEGKRKLLHEPGNLGRNAVKLLQCAERPSSSDGKLPMGTGRSDIDRIVPYRPVVVAHFSRLTHALENPRLDLRDLDAKVERQVVS